MYAYISLDTFYSSQVPDQDRAVVVVRGSEVVCANSVARLRGVHRGMHRTEAQTLVFDAHWVDYLPLDYAASQEAWLNEALHLVDQIQTDGQHACWLPMHSHASPEDLVRALVLRLGYDARAGIGSSRWLSRWASRLAEPGTVVTLDQVGPWLNELPIVSMPLTPEVVERCKRLGLHTVGQLLHVPMGQMRAQFGKESAAMMALARGYDTSIFSPDYPPNSFASRVDLPGGVEDRSSLDAALTTLGREMAQTLAEHDAEVRDVAITLEWADALPTRLERRFARPMRQGASLVLAARMMLENFALTEPIWGIRMQLMRTERVGQTQAAFETMQSATDRELQVRRCIRNITSLFGDSSLKPAGALSTTRRQQVLKAWKDAIGWQ